MELICAGEKTMDIFLVALPVHPADRDSSRESETCTDSDGQLLTDQQSPVEHTEDYESVEGLVYQRISENRSQVRSDSGTGEYPWFSFIDPSSTAEFLNDLTDELGKLFKAALQAHNGYNHVLTIQTSDGGLCLCQLGSQMIQSDSGTEGLHWFFFIDPSSTVES
ncbi:unnamed protein product [Larinioides sclopetarius]|uniref:Uncharacterized protein n=1 Tax=Larinioides sclopetarius TaxID=280406 RepID=A0AAV2B3N8_9ARAC